MIQAQKGLIRMVNGQTGGGLNAVKATGSHKVDMTIKGIPDH